MRSPNPWTGRVPCRADACGRARNPIRLRPPGTVAPGGITRTGSMCRSQRAGDAQFERPFDRNGADLVGVCTAVLHDERGDEGEVGGIRQRAEAGRRADRAAPPAVALPHHRLRGVTALTERDTAEAGADNMDRRRGQRCRWRGGLGRSGNRRRQARQTCQQYCHGLQAKMISHYHNTPVNKADESGRRAVSGPGGRIG